MYRTENHKQYATLLTITIIKTEKHLEYSSDMKHLITTILA